MMSFTEARDEFHRRFESVNVRPLRIAGVNFMTPDVLG